MEFPKHKQLHSLNNYGRSTILLITYLLTFGFKFYFLVSRSKQDYLRLLTTWLSCTNVNMGGQGAMEILPG